MQPRRPLRRGNPRWAEARSISPAFGHRGAGLRATALDNLTGKSILWVDDNPANNELAVRALRKFNLELSRQPARKQGSTHRRSSIW